MTPEIILGPPGCGKTTALLAEVDTLLQRGLAPEEICLVTFTRRAAHEAITRASEKFLLPQARFRWFRTLHSLAFRCLELTRGEVLEGRQLREFADWSGVAFTQRGQTWEEGWTGPEPGDRILHLDNLARVSERPLREVYDTTEHDLLWSEVRRVTTDLRNFKKARGLVDFTDMLENFCTGPPAPLRIRALLVDEAQDLSLLQWRVVEKLHKDNALVKFAVAGDDDQAIYEWAGAAVGHFVSLPGRARVLEQSWRVPGEVQALAVELLAGVERRREKVWRPRAEAGEVERVGSVAEIDFPPGEETLVLARNHIWLERDVAPLLRQEGVYYSLRGEASLTAETLSAVRGWETWRRGGAVHPEVARAIRRWLPSGERGTEPVAEAEEVTAADLGVGADRVWHEALTRMPEDEMAYVLSARSRGESLTGSPHVRLSTIHAAKGGQADHVVLLTDMAGRTAREAERDPDPETRVWYVGATRCRRRLTVVTRPSAPQNFPL